MGNRQNCAKFQENLFRSNEIISNFCPPLFRKRARSFAKKWREKIDFISVLLNKFS